MAIDNTFKKIEEQGISVMQDVFSPVLNRDVEITIESMDDANAEAISGFFTEEAVAVEVPIESTAEGSLYFLFSQKMAAAITDLMVMGDGSAEFDETESLDGVAEAVNQIIGAQSTWWRDELSVEVGFGSAVGSLRDAASLEVNFDDLVEIHYKMKVSDWGEDNFVKLIPRGVLELLSGPAESSVNMEADDSMGGGDFAPSGGGAGMESTPEAASQMGTQPSAKSVQFGAFDESHVYQGSPDDPKNLELLMDISLPVTIELGRTQMLIKDVLEIGPGSVIELQKLSGEPVDLYINDKRFALGEVVVIDENFGIRITELLSVEDRLKALK